MRLLPLLLVLALGAAIPGWAEVKKAPDLDKGAAALGLLKAIDEGFVQVYEKVAPAVVVIEVRKAPEEEDRDLARGFEYFLDEGKPPAGEPKPDANAPRPWRPSERSPRSEGSGFLIRPDGFILTNYHVVADAEKVAVRLRDGRVFPAKIVGTDDKTDIAIIRIDARDLPVVEFGDSDKLRVGQLVCAIGAPFNQDYSFSAGWVSGKGRSNLLSASSPTILFEDYIQTDAFINPGNSGGPLFDVEGKVVGMNTLINGIGRGLAFAIPAAMLEDVGRQLIATGKVQRPWLGIRIEALADKAHLRAHFVGIDSGVVVDTIEANAPAYKSDLRPADVITEVDGVKVVSARELQKQVLRKKIGQPVQLTIWRAGQTLRIAVPTGELPTELTRVANSTSAGGDEVRKEALDSRIRERTTAPGRAPGPMASTATLGLQLRDAKPAGAQVLDTVPDSPASRAFIFPEDIITGVESQPVTDAAGCVSAIATSLVTKGGQGVLLNIERKGQRTFVILQPQPERP